MNAQQLRVAFAINVGRNSIHILNVKKYSILLLIAFIVEKGDILRGSARQMRRGFIRKEGHVLDAGR